MSTTASPWLQIISSSFFTVRLCQSINSGRLLLAFVPSFLIPFPFFLPPFRPSFLLSFLPITFPFFSILVSFLPSIFLLVQPTWDQIWLYVALEWKWVWHLCHKPFDFPTLTSVTSDLVLGISHLLFPVMTSWKEETPAGCLMDVWDWASSSVFSLGGPVILALLSNPETRRGRRERPKGFLGKRASCLKSQFRAADRLWSAAGHDV